MSEKHVDVHVCGDDDRLEDRPACPNRLHDHPLPAGYTQAGMEAAPRINNHWGQRRCPDCKLYGWEKP